MPEIDQVRINFSEQDLELLNILLAVIIYGVALEIKPADFKALLKNPGPAIAGLSSQYILLPLITMVMVWFMQPQASFALGMFMVAACPGGNMSNFFTMLARGNPALSVSMTAVVTLLAVLMTPLIFGLLSSSYAPAADLIRSIELDGWVLAKLVMLILGVPLLLGMLTRYFFTALAIKMSVYFKVGGVILFMGLIVIAVFNNLDLLRQYFYVLFVLVVLQNGFALMGGYALGIFTGQNEKNKRTLAIETGIQNSGLGLVLIFTFFDQLGGMAMIAAMWGVWHMISGLGIASFFAWRDSGLKP